MTKNEEDVTAFILTQIVMEKAKNGFIGFRIMVADGMGKFGFYRCRDHRFSQGHGAMATSWSLPGSECSLDSCFGDDCRGPVRFQLDLEQVLVKSSGKFPKGKRFPNRKTNPSIIDKRKPSKI